MVNINYKENKHINKIYAECHTLGTKQSFFKSESTQFALVIQC